VIESLHPFDVEYLTNPSQEQLRAMALEHTPCTFETAQGNLNKVTRNKARMAKFTYVVAPDSDVTAYSHQVLDRNRADELIARQRRYIEESGKLIEVRGFLGLGPHAVPVQWLYTVEGANIAGMQSVLACPVEGVLDDPAAFAPEFRVVYTPDLMLDDMPGRQAILVDLVNFTTYIMGPDYFGESKKAALRMLNEWTYQRGGLTLHAGAKRVRVGDNDLTMTIMGLSGTGKTTTTFSKQGALTQPIQDDMVTLWPHGELTITENGCFAKTIGLSEETEPVIYHGTMSAEAWVENGYTDDEGRYDFFKGVLTPEEVAAKRDVLVRTGAPAENVERYVSGQVSIDDIRDANGVLHDGWDFVKWTENGRSIIPMSAIEDAADLEDIPPVRSMGILNRDEGADAATPGIITFASPEQAAGYFMLGETTKTSAAGKETGKTRSPFTQPFFPRAFGLQAHRFSELAASMPDVGLWMMNTGYVGGSAREVQAGTAHKVKIRHSSAMLEALLADAIKWTPDPDFGYLVPDVDDPANAALLEKVPAEILQPRLYYERTGRMDEYRAWVAEMKRGRRAFLESFEVEPEIIAATVND
jgi:phosphoenolpyruvate carboxykinase (ATP)